MVYELCASLVNEASKFSLVLIDDETGLDVNQAINFSSRHIGNLLKQNRSKTMRDKQYEHQNQYVEPTETVLGTCWNMANDQQTNTKYPDLIPTTMQYVPITKTVEALMRRDDFRNAFMEYNFDKKSEGAHDCQPGLYKSFCCGEVYQKSDFYKREPKGLQIHIGADDFQITNPLQPKSAYKICGVYFVIQNISQKFLSRTDNIFMVCICFADEQNRPSLMTFGKSL